MGKGEEYNHAALPECYVPRRFNIVTLGFFAITLAYMMRANLSIAILEMAKDFDWKLSNKGLFLSSFFWGYITTQLIGGMAARRFGAKFMMAFVIVVPSIFTLFVPLVAARSEFLFIACRVLTGVAAGATFPTCFLLIGSWIPFSEKSTTLAIVYSGVNVGTIVMDVVGPVIMAHLGWQFVFYISGGSGFVWLIFWVMTTSSTPREMKNIHPLEVKYIEDISIVPPETTILINEAVKYIENVSIAPVLETTVLINKAVNADEQPKLLDSKEALAVLVSNSSFWNIVICALCTNWGQYVFLTWLPTYVNSELHFDVQISGIIAVTPSISGALVSFVAGKFCDILLSKGYNLLHVRKSFYFAGCVMYIGTLLGLAFKDRLGLSNVQAAILLATGTGGGGFHVPGYSANIYDIAPYHPSIVVGISNTAGTIPGIVGVFLTGYLLEQGLTWGDIWILTASFYATALVVNLIFCNVKRVV